jgi:hypothetical protein
VVKPKINNPKKNWGGPGFGMLALAGDDSSNPEMENAWKSFSQILGSIWCEYTVSPNVLYIYTHTYYITILCI